MKWEDLEIGDVLKYTDEYYIRVVGKQRFDPPWRSRGNFTIKTIIYKLDALYLYFIETNSGSFSMNINNGADRDYDNIYNGPAFEIVSLKED